MLLIKLVTGSGPIVLKVWQDKRKGYMELRGPGYVGDWEAPSVVSQLFDNVDGKKVASIMAGEVTALRPGERSYEWLLELFNAQ